MKKRILVAGAGNIFLGDDAFGVEAVRALERRKLPDAVQVKDFGIRSFDLAYALLDDWEAVILVDAVSRGDAPGTLYTIEPELPAIPVDQPDTSAFDGHSMDPVTVIRLAMSMGDIRPRLFVVGCEPADLGGEEGRMGLTEPVQGALEEAADMVEELAERLLVPTTA